MRRFDRKDLFVIWVALLAGTLAIAGCGETNKQNASSRPAPQVVIETVQSQRIELTTELPGRTSAFRTAEIRPQVNGLILKRNFTEGADVKAGDLLYQIDPATFQAALDNAKAALGRTMANYPAIASRAKRYKQLLAQKAVSQQDYDDADAALNQAEADIQYWKASVSSAEINLAYTRITAPISGRIGRSNVSEGAIVTAYQPVALATIQQLDPIYVDVNQSTAELLRLRRRLEEGRLDQNGQSQNKVNLILEDGVTYSQEGTLKFRDVTVEPTTGSITLRVVFPNPDGMLLPNMFVRAIIREGFNPQAILIPQQAVARDPKGNPTVLIVDADSKVQQRMLTLDRAIQDQWLVLTGLDPGDRVIVEGLQKVRPGSPAQVVQAAPGASESENRAVTAPKAN